LVPVIAAIGTILAYIIRYRPSREPWNMWLNDLAVPVGIAAALGTWLLLALVGRRVTGPDRANIHAYGELIEHLDSLCGQYEETCGVRFWINPGLGSSPPGCREAWRHIDAIRNQFRTSGLRWVTGDGYTAIGERLHRAEEALIVAQPRERVLQGALHDEMRLHGSVIDHHDNLLAKLTRAVEVLGGAGYLTPAPTTQAGVPTGQAARNPEADVVALAIVDAQARALSLPPAAERAALGEEIKLLTDALTILLPDDAVRSVALARARALKAAEPEARAVLAGVRYNINVYRDSLRDALVHSRNHLLWTMTMSGATAYVLLALAVVTAVRHEAIETGAAFFLVGALFGGLVNKLRNQSSEAIGVEDFKLSEARLFLTPILSGLAGVGGVAVTAIGAEVLTAALADGGSGATTASFGLRHAFDWTRSDRFVIGLVVAAIFGLSPERLITRLNNQAEQAKVDLKNSASPNTAH